MECAGCGAEFVAGHKFCAQCGKPVDIRRFCPNCGGTIQHGSAFCPSCGAAQGTPSDRPPVKAQPPVAAAPLSSKGTPQPQAAPQRRKQSAPWGRLAAGLAVVALAALAVMAPEEWWDIFSATVAPSQKTMSLGAASYTPPTADRLVQTKEWGTIPANQLLVLLQDGQVRKDAERIAGQLGARIAGELEFIQFYQLETPTVNAAQLVETMAKARSLPGVELAFPHLSGASRDGPTSAGALRTQTGTVSGVSCSPLDNAVYRQGTNARPYEMIGLQRAWDFLRASGTALGDVHVGVVDTDVDTLAGDFKGSSKIYGLQKGDIVTHGFLSHGTEVTNMIGGRAENQGVVGTAAVLGDKLSISVTATQDRAGYTLAGNLVQATPNPNDPTQIDTGWGTYSFKYFVDIQSQIEAGATIINASWGASRVGPWHKDMSDTWRKFLLRMNKEHPEVLFVNAAGNGNEAIDGHNDWMSGQKLPNLITVGGLDTKGDKWADSDYATGDGEITIAAGSQGVVAGISYISDKPDVTEGNSFAAPQVTGAAAILRSLNPKLAAADIKRILVETAAPGVAGKDKAGNDISVLVPREVGGKVMRVDNAVLKVINDLRQAKGLPVFERATLEKLADVDIAASSTKPMEYTIRAIVGAVSAGGTDVSIELQGQGSIGGLSRQHLAASGEISWGFTFMKPNDSVNVIVRRLDTGGCSMLSLKAEAVPTPTARAGAPSAPTAKPATFPATIKGSWAGNATLTAVSFPANSRYRFNGKVGEPYLQSLDFLGNSPETGNVIATGQFNFQAPYQYKDGTVTSQSDFKDSGGSGSFRLEARVSPAPGGGYTLEGTIKFSEQEQAGTGEMAGNIRLVAK